jgi:antitoxin ParD1/3/4
MQVESGNRIVCKTIDQSAKLAKLAKPEYAVATMNISLTDELRDFVEQQVREKSFTSSSEYLRQLIRENRELESFKSLIDAGAKAPITGKADAGYFAALRKRASQRKKTSAE